MLAGDSGHAASSVVGVHDEEAEGQTTIRHHSRRIEGSQHDRQEEARQAAEARLRHQYAATEDTGHPGERRATSRQATNLSGSKAYTAFLAYIALGARRSVREAARQHHIKALSAGEICGQENTTVSTWLAWSAKHKWVSRAHDFLTSTDSEIFLRGTRAFTLLTPADSARGGCLGADRGFVGRAG